MRDKKEQAELYIEDIIYKTELLKENHQARIKLLEARSVIREKLLQLLGEQHD